MILSEKIQSHPGYVALKELSECDGKKELPTLVSSYATTLLEQYNNTTSLGWAGNVASTTLKNGSNIILIPSVVLAPFTGGASLALGAAAGYFTGRHIYNNAKNQADQEYNTGIGLYGHALTVQKAHVQEVSQKVSEVVGKVIANKDRGEIDELNNIVKTAGKNLSVYQAQLRTLGYRDGFFSSDVRDIAKPLETAINEALPKLYSALIA